MIDTYYTLWSIHIMFFEGKQFLLFTTFHLDRYLAGNQKINPLFIHIFVFREMERRFVFTSFVTTCAIDYYTFINRNGFSLYSMKNTIYFLKTLHFHSVFLHHEISLYNCLFVKFYFIIKNINYLHQWFGNDLMENFKHICCLLTTIRLCFLKVAFSVGDQFDPFPPSYFKKN